VSARDHARTLSAIATAKRRVAICEQRSPFRRRNRWPADPRSGGASGVRQGGGALVTPSLLAAADRVATGHQWGRGRQVATDSHPVRGARRAAAPPSCVLGFVDESRGGWAARRTWIAPRGYAFTVSSATRRRLRSKCESSLASPSRRTAARDRGRGPSSNRH
jgi:hypothetical protein